MLPRTLQQRADFFIRDLGEVLVPAADPEEGLRRRRADDRIRLMSQRLDGVRWRHRYGHHDLRRRLMSDHRVEGW
jgi:hypothetical protein